MHRMLVKSLFSFTVGRSKLFTSHHSGLRGMPSKLECSSYTREFCVSAELTPRVKKSVGHTDKAGEAYHIIARGCRDFERNLFEALSNVKGKVSVSKFIADLQNVGFRVSDPRLRGVFRKLRELQTPAAYSWDEHAIAADLQLDRQTFYECIHDGMDIVHMAYTSDLVIPNFSEFTSTIDSIYWNCFNKRHGQVASYIPQLSRYNPDYWGVSVCTIDGQRHSIGDVHVPFSLQSGSKAVTYALALTELGQDVVHQYVGHEPSGHSFNHIKLGHGNKPHNPMINAGAIVITSLLKSNYNLADRFDYVIQKFNRLAGGEFIGFNNSIFLSERETADRNMALAYYLKENKCFPEGTNLQETMDFYFQLCSTEVNCESASVMAATLANGGICPITGESILDAEAVCNTLSLMHSCGMYDYSGEFAFKVGLPAKSGVSGMIMLVVPNVCGICLWSPPIDSFGNSARALAFCEELVRTFNFHHFDNLRHIWSEKKDPRVSTTNQYSVHVVSLLFSAGHGDLNALKRMWLSGKDMQTVDYDGRTALHLVAAEGHYDCAKFLLEVCGVNPCPRDRWGHIPYDDALQFNNASLADLLKLYMDSWQVPGNLKAIATNNADLPVHSSDIE